MRQQLPGGRFDLVGHWAAGDAGTGPARGNNSPLSLRGQRACESLNPPVFTKGGRRRRTGDCAGAPLARVRARYDAASPVAVAAAMGDGAARKKAVENELGARARDSGRGGGLRMVVFSRGMEDGWGFLLKKAQRMFLRVVGG